MTARAVADVTTGTVLASIDIAAAPDRVWRALTTSELTRWWGDPAMYTTTTYTADLTPGGRWRTDGVGADGSPFHVEGEFLAVEAPHRLVQTWQPSWDPTPPTTLTWRLDATATGTRVILRHEGFGPHAASCESHAQGLERVLSWLARHHAPDRRPFLLRLLAPRPTFPFDMTDDERAVMAEHVAYWRGLLAEGTAVVFGPVADPAGPWGLGVVSVADAAAVAGLEAADPVIRSGRGFRYEVLPMLQAVHG